MQPLFGAKVAGDVADQQLEVAADDLQHVIEVVRNAAGELPDRFHLLRLAQLRFRRRPFGDDGRNALFQHLVGLAQNAFGFLAVLDVDDRADIAAKFPIIRKTRPGRTQSPAIAAVLAPQTIFDPKRLRAPHWHR